MTLYVNARFLTQPVSGVQRYAHELLRAFDRFLLNNSVIRAEIGPVEALVPETVESPGWRAISLRVIRGGQGHIWEQTSLFRASRNGILLSLGNSGPIRHQCHVLALHDANIYKIPEAFSRRYLALHQTLRPVLARRATRLISVSRFSAQELGRHLGIDESRFRILPNSAAHMLRIAPDPTALATFGLKPRQYLLSVGNQSPNKNIGRLISAHEMAGTPVPPLVVVGGLAPGVRQSGLQASNRVQLLGRVGDGALRALYKGAAGFVFPSLYEGFGIPPLEAMQAGVPVLAARSSAMPEVLGNAAMWFDPCSVSDIARELSRFAMLSSDDWETLAAKGRVRAACFSWQSSAEMLTNLLREVRIEKEALGRPVTAPPTPPHELPVA